MLNAGVLAFDAVGKIVTIEPGVVPPQFNGGTPTGLLGALQATTIGSQPHAGLLYDGDGHLAVANGGVIAGHAQGGMPVDSAGKLCVDYDATPAYWLAGIPFDAAGRVVVVSPVPPAPLDQFSSAFSTAFK